MGIKGLPEAPLFRLPQEYVRILDTASGCFYSINSRELHFAKKFGTAKAESCSKIKISNGKTDPVAYRRKV